MYDKQKVREFMQKRVVERKVKAPVPTPEEIRRQLGPAPTTKQRR